MTTREVDTPRGPARVHCERVDAPSAVLVLGHGAGGGITAADLTVVADTARSAGLAVALVEQPYRVAGRRSPPPAAHLDAAWTAVVSYLGATDFRDLPLVVGGRSSGARVACRTAAATGAAGVLCLAFPLEPPTRRSDARRPESRLAELDSVRVPTLVVQGRRDSFGIPPPASRRTVVTVCGDHSLRTGLEEVPGVVAEWLAEVLASVGDSGSPRDAPAAGEPPPHPP